MRSEKDRPTMNGDSFTSGIFVQDLDELETTKTLNAVVIQAILIR